jgi:hypothetical protein
MFERVRHSRSRKEKKRSTLKVQRGGDFAVVGGNAHGMPAAALTDAADIAIWHAGITTAGLGTPPLDLKILFTSIAVLTTDTTPDMKATRINTWFKFIGEQNKVVRIVSTHIQREFLKRVLAGFTPAGGVAIPAITPLTSAGKSYTTAAEIDALQGEELSNLVTVYADKLKLDYVFLRDLLKRLVTQFEAVMNMGQGTDFSKVIPTNKFEEMFSDSQKNKNLIGGGIPGSELYTKMVREFEGSMINPQRIESVLAEEVASVLRMYKDPVKLTDDIKRIHPLPAPGPRGSIAAVDEKETNLSILVERLSQHVFANTMQRTGKEVQDGWVLGSKPVFLNAPVPAPAGLIAYYDTYTSTKFFEDFYRTLSAQFVPASNSFTLSRIVGSNPANPAVDDAHKYGILAAKLLIAKLNNKTIEDLYPSPPPAVAYYFHPKTQAGVAGRGGRPVPGTNFDGIPNFEYYTVAYKPGKTLEEMYKWIDPNIDSRFMIHLQYQLDLP